MPPEPAAGYAVRVAGDAACQDELGAIVASSPVDPANGCRVRAHLVAGGHSVFDRDAVVVEVSGLKVGYLGLAEARLYRALPMPPLDVAAVIIGVPERTGASEPVYQMWLALSLAP